VVDEHLEKVLLAWIKKDVCVKAMQIPSHREDIHPVEAESVVKAVSLDPKRPSRRRSKKEKEKKLTQSSGEERA